MHLIGRVAGGVELPEPKEQITVASESTETVGETGPKSSVEVIVEATDVPIEKQRVLPAGLQSDRDKTMLHNKVDEKVIAQRQEGFVTVCWLPQPEKANRGTAGSQKLRQGVSKRGSGGPGFISHLLHYKLEKVGEVLERTPLMVGF